MVKITEEWAEILKEEFLSPSYIALREFLKLVVSFCAALIFLSLAKAFLIDMIQEILSFPSFSGTTARLRQYQSQSRHPDKAPSSACNATTHSHRGQIPPMP